MSKLVTTLGALREDELGLILPHEHIFVDFRPPDHPEYGLAEIVEVVEVMALEVESAHALGVTAMVDSTPVGVGRRIDILKAVSEVTRMPIVVPTGIYREPNVPAWARAASEDDLTNWMVGELRGEIEGSGVQAGWIKLGVSDEGITPSEVKILRAAARAGRETNAVIGVHTQQGCVVLDQLDIIEEAGYTAERFIWIHTQSDPDFSLHLEVARRGAWLEYDGIGYGDDEYYLEAIPRVINAGLADQVLLSQDRGWYDPAKPGGGEPMPFTYLIEHFLPKLKAIGVDGNTIHALTHTNPYRAFAR